MFVVILVCQLSYGQQSQPFNLSVVGPVVTTSDSRATDFKNNYLSNVLALNVKSLKNVGDISINGMTMKNVDPSKIDLITYNQSRMYFVFENAGYKNTIGFNTEGDGLIGNPKIAISNASSPPLKAGDYVDLGMFNANSNLDFFIISDGARHVNYTSPANLSAVLSTNSSVNLDGLVHVKSWIIKDSPYLLMSYEDMYGGGDKDYNDLLFVVDIGGINIQNIFGAPEPSMALLLASFIGIISLYRKER